MTEIEHRNADVEGWAIVAFVLGLLTLLGAGVGPGMVVAAAASTTREDLFGGLVVAGVVTVVPVFATFLAALTAQRAIRSGAGGAGLAKAGVILAVFGLFPAIVAIGAIYLTVDGARVQLDEQSLSSAVTTTSSPVDVPGGLDEELHDDRLDPGVGLASKDAACEMMSEAVQSDTLGDLVARALILVGSSGDPDIEEVAVEARATAPAGEFDLSGIYEHCAFAA